MAIARKNLVDPEHRLCYHLTTNCVRGAFLCGKEKRTGKNYSHRKQWIIDGLHQLAPCFSLNIFGYAIMDNHFHLVIEYDPKANLKWSDEEVADRWVQACPKKHLGQVDAVKTEVYRAWLLGNPKELARVRGELGSMSTFMQRLKWSIAYRANQEDGCKGHFFEKRFWSGAILDQPALIASMAYVDLNAVRAKIVSTIEGITDASISERLLNVTEEKLKEAIPPIVGGLEAADSELLEISLQTYLNYLELLIPKKAKATDIERRWIEQVTSIGKRQRAYGCQHNIDKWLVQRNFRPLESPLPV